MNNFEKKMIDQSSVKTPIFTIYPNKEFSNINSLADKRNYLSGILHRKGALPFRDFQAHSSDNFKKISNVFVSDFISDNGEHIPLSDTKGVFTPVSYSEKEKLLWHNENSFNMSWPLVIIFGSSIPAKEGGETPIVDSRLVLSNIDKDIVSEFLHKGVMYVRTHGFGFGRSWQQVYQTNNKYILENKLKQNNIIYEWYDSDKLITKQVRPSIVKHPISGELSWFNQAQHWHPYCLQSEVREYLLHNFSDKALPRNCYFGDGTKISDDVIQHILDVYQEYELSFTWEKGDVMVVDNVLFAHARNPFVGERKLFVTMGKQVHYLSGTSIGCKLEARNLTNL